MKMHEKWVKTHILGTFRRLVSVQFEFVPVQLWFWSFLTNLYRYKLDLYRYNPVLFSSFYQFSYFGYNLLISYPI